MLYEVITASPIVDNHMIAVYRDSITEENIFLDATNSYIEFGMPTGFIQGKQIMINDGDGYYIDTIPEVVITSYSIHYTKLYELFCRSCY